MNTRFSGTSRSEHTLISTAPRRVSNRTTSPGRTFIRRISFGDMKATAEQNRKDRGRHVPTSEIDRRKIPHLALKFWSRGTTAIAAVRWPLAMVVVVMAVATQQSALGSSISGPRKRRGILARRLAAVLGPISQQSLINALRWSERWSVLRRWILSPGAASAIQLD